MGTLDGKVAIITGAGQGVGRCHAELFAAEGASVVVNDMNETADEVAETINAAGGTAIRADQDSDFIRSLRPRRSSSVSFRIACSIAVTNSSALANRWSGNCARDLTRSCSTARGRPSSRRRSSGDASAIRPVVAVA